MSIITVATAKGAAGASTVAFELVRYWPNPVVGIEIDPSGGTWALRHSATWQPGLLTFTSKRGLDLSWEALREHGHQFGQHALIICAPPNPDHIQTAIQHVAQRLLHWPQGLDLIIDTGRLHPATLPIHQLADQTIVVTNTEPADIAVVQHHALNLQLHGVAPIICALTTNPAVTTTEISHICATPMLTTTVAYDSSAIRNLTSRRGRHLARNYQQLSHEIYGLVAHNTENAANASDAMAGDWSGRATSETAASVGVSSAGARSEGGRVDGVRSEGVRAEGARS